MLKDRLQSLFDENPKLTKAGLARFAGVSQPSVGAWFDGNSKSIRAAHLSLVAKYCGVNELWLATGKGDKRPADYVPGSETDDGYSRLDVLEAEAGMGDGYINDDFPEVVRSMSVSHAELRNKLGYVPRPGRIKLLTGRGDSMPGLIEPGEIVWVDTAVQSFEGDGVYLINTGFGHQFKLLQARDRIYVVSSNPAYPEFPAPDGMLIGGRAIINVRIRKMA